MAHASPLPQAPGCLPASAQHTSSSGRSSPPFVGPRFRSLTPPHQRDASPHARRLQLRHAGFRAPAIPARRITPCGSTLEGALHAVRNDEDSPSSLEKRMQVGEELPPIQPSILQELSDSTRRKRLSQTRSLPAIFRDAAASRARRSPQTDDGSRRPSNTPPSRRPSTPATAVRRAKTPGSPPSTSRRSQLRKSTTPSGERERYIRHLEDEMAAMQAKLEDAASPSKPSARVRALLSQVAALKKEVREWEEKYDERLADEISQRSRAERELGRQVQSLRDQVDGKASKIRELEWELESTKVKLREAESLEQTNTSLGRRVDVLTELLAQSPTRMGFAPQFPPPGPMSPPAPPYQPRAGRPQSLFLPKLPISPSGKENNPFDLGPLRWGGPRSDAVVGERPSSIHGNCGEGTWDCQSSQCPSVESHGISSPSPADSSRPSSLVSGGSGVSPWGMPPAWDESARANRVKAKMRRFPSGVGTLKPLILPTAAGVPQPISAPATHRAPLGEISHNSSHRAETIPFRPDGTVFSTPTNPCRRRSRTWELKQALEALEGRPEWSHDGQVRPVAPARHIPEVPIDADSGAYEPEEVETHSPCPAPASTKRLSLQSELDEAEQEVIRSIEDALDRDESMAWNPRAEQTPEPLDLGLFPLDEVSPPRSAAAGEGEVGARTEAPDGRPQYRAPPPCGRGQFPATEVTPLLSPTARPAHSGTPARPLCSRCSASLHGSPAPFLTSTTLITLISRLQHLTNSVRSGLLDFLGQLLVVARTRFIPRVNGAAGWLLCLVLRFGRHLDGTPPSTDESLPGSDQSL